MIYAAWIVFGPDGKPIQYSFNLHKNHNSEKGSKGTVSLSDEHWSQMYQDGYRCKKIEFKVIEK